MSIIDKLFQKQTQEQKIKAINDDIEIAKAISKLREVQAELAEQDAKIANAKKKNQSAQPKKSLMDIFDGKGGA